MKIINSPGQQSRSENVEASNIDTHIAAHDRWSAEARILRAYINDPQLVDADPVAWKWADPTEDARFLFDEGEATEIERIHPSLIVRITVVWE